MGGSLSDLKLEVIRGPKVIELSKVVLYKPADFSYALFTKFRNLDFAQCALKTALRFGDPSFCLDGPAGTRVKGWLLRTVNIDEIVYLESWPWEPSFFVYTSGNETLMVKLLGWLSGSAPELHLVKGAKKNTP